jgi:hypothetical protein
MGTDSSVDIATDYRLDSGGYIPDRGKIFFSVQTSSRAHPASCAIGKVVGS